MKLDLLTEAIKSFIDYVMESFLMETLKDASVNTKLATLIDADVHGLEKVITVLIKDIKAGDASSCHVLRELSCPMIERMVMAGTSPDIDKLKAFVAWNSESPNKAFLTKERKNQFVQSLDGSTFTCKEIYEVVLPSKLFSEEEIFFWMMNIIIEDLSKHEMSNDKQNIRRNNKRRHSEIVGLDLRKKLDKQTQTN